MLELDEKEDYFDYLDGKDFWEINKAAYHATVTAHSKKLPCMTFELDELDAYHFWTAILFLPVRMLFVLQDHGCKSI